MWWSRLLCGVIVAVLAVWGGAGRPCFASEAPLVPAVPAFRAQVEQDWLNQEEWRRVPSADVTAEQDAAGGCDGVKDGKWGFHTAHVETPWWQVDLGASKSVTRVAIWNRCDGVSERAFTLQLAVSEDGATWRTVYTHDGTPFFGFSDQKPLIFEMPATATRYLRVQLPSAGYFHLDEVEVFGPDAPDANLALKQPATQSGVSEWSSDHLTPLPVNLAERIPGVLADCARLAVARAAEGLDVAGIRAALERLAALGDPADDAEARARYFEARWLRRALALMDPALDIGQLLFCKRVPGSYNHMSDQYYGWWSRPGGGLCLLEGWRENAPQARCITESFSKKGSFLRPDIDFEAQRVLFAWCKYYPGLAENPDKLNKDNVPADAFYHLFELNLDGSRLRQLTRGKYDDFDGRYLPDGRIVFLSTRRGQSMRCGNDCASGTAKHDAQPDAYVRCGGGPERPVAVYTLHVMEGDGQGITAISPFEMFEWTPAVADDGTIMYSRWDYIDRDNMPYMSLWSIHPDGTNARLVYGNFTHAPHCTFEPMCIPDSNKIVFTGSGHHAQTMGSLVLLDTAAGTEQDKPITRLTPEVKFPEIEAWPVTYFANPWPLNEELYFVSWGREDTPRGGQLRAENAMGLYLYERSGFLELLYRDPAIGCESPIPVRPRPRPPVLPRGAKGDPGNEGRFYLSNVYEGLPNTVPGTIRALRIVAVPPKTHPTMNAPGLGLMHDDPGKCVLGTVPVEADGSAHFRAPAGTILFFQALDERGMAVQTMRSVTYVQPGQTLSCVGCHESRNSAPPVAMAMAIRRSPSLLTPPPPGAWPYRFEQLVQPVLDARCVSCHNPTSKDEQAAQFLLTPEHAYESLTGYGAPSITEQVHAQYREGRSVEGAGLAANSALLKLLLAPGGHQDLVLNADDTERLVTWLDTYAQRLGSFSEKQEQELQRERETAGYLSGDRRTGDKVARHD